MLDPPATIAVLGAGPVGLEAALYARYLGYDVVLLERDTVAAQVERWSRWPLLQPWGACVSKLGLAALHAQDPKWRPPRADEGITAHEWRQRYLSPLAESDLLAQSLREHTEVLLIARCEVSARANDELPCDELPDEEAADNDEGGDDEPGEEEPAPPEFRLSVRDSRTQAALDAVLAHAIIDATGGGGRWTHLSGSQTPLPGEIAAALAIAAGLADIRGAERATFAGRTTIVVGAGFTALANLAALVELAAAEPGTKIVWITPPLGGPATDPLLATETWHRASIRPELPVIAARLAGRCSQLQHFSDCRPAAVEPEHAGAVQLMLDDRQRTTIRGDLILNNLAIEPAAARFFGLEVQTCSVSGSPLAMFSQGDPRFAGRHVAPAWCQIAGELMTSQANYYVLGSKSFGARGDEFLLRGGWEQVRALFTWIGGRPALDLYATMDNLLPRM